MRALAAIFISVWCLWAGAACARVLVFVPASMTDVMQDLAQAFQAKQGEDVVLSMASTARLARQLEAGAPADLFITADKDWMERSRQRGLVRGDSVVPFAGNRLVVAVRREIENWAETDAMLTTTRFAMADEDSVPAGRYAKQALVSRGLWQRAAPLAVRGDNVRATLQMVARGEVEAAVVYATDVAVAPQTRVAFTFPEDQHDPIRYYAALTKDAGAGSAAPLFLTFLTSNAARALLHKHGFSVPPFEAPR